MQANAWQSFDINILIVLLFVFFFNDAVDLKE